MRFLVKSVAALLILFFAMSCERHAPPEQYSNGFFSTERPLSKTEYRWQLWRSFQGKSGLVCEAVVSDNMVLTFMPTVLSQLTSWRGGQETVMCGSFAEAHLVESTYSYYRLFRQKRGENQSASADEVLCRPPQNKMLSLNQFSNDVQRVSNLSKDCYAVLEVETPCRFDQFKFVVGQLTRISGCSLAILPHVQREIDMSWEEMAEIVDSGRYREARQGPDTPVLLPDQQVSQVERDFIRAKASHSTDDLEYFIASHPNEGDWTRKGLFALGALYKLRGQHSQAIDVYRKAIKLLGTNTVLEQATRITVSDLANVEIARCLNTMGRYRESASNLNEVQMLQLRESVKVGSHEPNPWKQRGPTE